MSFLGGMKSGRRFWAVALAVIVGGALGCVTDPADMQFQAGDYIFDFLADGTLTGGVPAGDNTISTFAIVLDFSLAGPDEFDRSTDGAGSYYTSDGGIFGAGWNISTFLSNGASDMRTPTLVEDDVPQVEAAIGDGHEVGVPGVFNPFTNAAMVNLKPNQTYIVALFRYALIVNGELDQLQTLAGETVDQPDALVVDGGTGPAGDPTVPIVSFPTFIPYIENANPFIVGSFTTNAAGEGAFDAVVDEFPNGEFVHSVPERRHGDGLAALQLHGGPRRPGRRCRRCRGQPAGGALADRAGRCCGRSTD
jgi:hypothetical protein